MFSSSIKSEFAADKEISFDEKKQQFVISYNAAYLIKYSLQFLIIGLVLGAMTILFMKKSFWIGLISFIVLSFPFIAFGFRYFYMSMKTQKIIIDLTSKQIHFSKSLSIPFYSIKQFSLTQVNFYDPEYSGRLIRMKKVSSWQITIEDFKENKIILCKSEKKGQAKKIIEEFSRTMEVKLKEGTEIC